MKTKFKYRIVVIDDEDQPFMIQRKSWLFWRNIGQTYTVSNAETKIKELLQQQAKYTVGSVVKVYTEADLLVDKLRGK